VTQSFHLGSRGEVLAWLRSAEQTAHLSHRGRGQLVKGSTLYFGKQSRRWSLKLYSKGQEIIAKGHGQDSILDLPHAIAWADCTLRAELTLRSMELKRMQLSIGKDWIHQDGVPSEVTAQLLRDRFGGMTMTTTTRIGADTLATFRPALRAAVAAWEAGHDLRAMFAKATFYKFRAELLPHGIDIATLVPRDAISNVVPLFKTLEAMPVGVPDWAQGTPLYFEPARVA
jgi:II/X family phage/plasmid replication protein